MSQLVQLLEVHAEALVRRWLEAVRAGPPPPGKSEPELRDHIPDFLRELMVALRSGKAPEKSSAAAEHGRQRYRIGFDVDALVREYGLLRGFILDLIEQTGCPMSLSELRVLTDFFASAIAEAVREHGQQQRHAELTLAQAHVQELREREERYRTVFEFIDDGFCLLQLLFDAEERPVDYRFLEANAAFEVQTGLKDAIGKTARELVPDLDDSWFQLYGKVALTGETARFENHAPAMGRWFEVYASRVGRPELRQVALVFKDTTERKALLEREQAARAQVEVERQRLLCLFEQAPVAIAINEGPLHTFAFANPAFHALVGRCDLAGKPFLEALPEVRGQGFDVVLDRVVATGEPFVGNEVPALLDRPGRGTPDKAFYNFVYSPKRDAQGQVDGVLHCGYDVTELVLARQQAEELAERLRESEERLRRVVEASVTGTWELDVATEMLVADARLREISGLSPDEPFSLSRALALVHPEDSPRVSQAIAEAMAGSNGGRYHEEYRIVGAQDGRPRWVEARGHAQFGADGKPVRVLGTVVEVTPRKEAEAAREELLASLINQPVFGVALLREARLVFERANAAYRQMVGNREVEGKSLLEALPELVGQGLEAQLRGVQRTGIAFIGREVHVRIDRRGQGLVEDAYFNAVYQPVHAPGGACDDVLLIVHDVTETVRARMETARRRALEKERADFEQQLIGIVSHDLRNPLNAILLSTTALARREELDERTTKAVMRIQSSADRAVRMVKDLLDFTQARLGTGIPVHPRPFDLHAHTRLVVEEVQANFPERTIELEATGDGEGAWDADRLAQLVTNLVSNALKYSPQDTVVRVRTRGWAEGVELEVHNEGAPIPPEATGRLFEPLQRVSSKADTSGRSVGLGLYIVRHIVAGHGGSVEVRSTAQQGTTFSVRLPRRPPEPTG